MIPYSPTFPLQIQLIPRKMFPPPVGLFLYISKLVQLQNPTLIMTHDAVAPTSFCSGEYFPVMCHQYSSVNTEDTVSYVQVRK